MVDMRTMMTITAAAGTGSARTAEVQEGTVVEAEALTGDVLLLIQEADLAVTNTVNHPEEDYLTLRRHHHQLIENSWKWTTEVLRAVTVFYMTIFIDGRQYFASWFSMLKASVLIDFTPGFLKNV